TGSFSTFHGSLWSFLFEDQRLVSSGIQNHAPEPNIFQCPTLSSSFLTAAAAPATVFFSNKANGNQYGRYSYAFNNQALPAGASSAINFDSFSVASQTVAVVESFYWNTGDGNGAFYTSLGAVPHNEQANFLFYDGHVERFGREKIPTITNRSSVFWHGENATY